MSRAGGIEIVRVAGPGGQVLRPELLEPAQPVHRQLRPHLSGDYVQQMRDIFVDGAEMVVAIVDGTVRGLAVFRIFSNTHAGRRFYVDDLVTDEMHRSSGVGSALLRWLEAASRERGCNGVDLESGTQRTRAHRFYFREGFFVTGFSFRKAFE